mmetsp:Transcript_15336/g.33152  ORF Transcript_15336/g.33152 Transcript_15336/m.33152 type:complete len:294 (-) Transcript_15336:1511-2392(-)
MYGLDSESCSFLFLLRGLFLYRSSSIRGRSVSGLGGSQCVLTQGSHFCTTMFAPMYRLDLRCSFLLFLEGCLWCSVSYSAVISGSFGLQCCHTLSAFLAASNGLDFKGSGFLLRKCGFCHWCHVVRLVLSGILSLFGLRGKLFSAFVATSDRLDLDSSCLLLLQCSLLHTCSHTRGLLNGGTVFGRDLRGLHGCHFSSTLFTASDGLDLQGSRLLFLWRCFLHSLWLLVFGFQLLAPCSYNCSVPLASLDGLDLGGSSFLLLEEDEVLPARCLFSRRFCCRRLNDLLLLSSHL